MHLCRGDASKLAGTPIKAHIYQSYGGTLYFCSIGNNLINLQTGHCWCEGAGFDGDDFIDVTDDYCLTRRENDQR